VSDSGPPYHMRPDAVEIHRAIGGYITAFSKVVTAMRHGITIFKGGGYSSGDVLRAAVS
jgi:hypothetical protein